MIVKQVLKLKMLILMHQYFQHNEAFFDEEHQEVEFSEIRYMSGNQRYKRKKNKI